jgi:CRISPR-associated exonuclease Cas4
MADSSPRAPPKQVNELISAVSEASFSDWHHDQQYAENIRNGKHYFNHPSPPQPARRHSPSKLLTCHRKTYYSQQNAPEERRDPKGVFWFGSQFEQELAVPFLRTLVGPDQYVQNSLWVDFEVPSNEGPLHFRGETDPVIVDEEASPLLLTEIKTTSTSLDALDRPKPHHRAQAHAYMYGLSQGEDIHVDDCILLYGHRDQLTGRTFHVPFDHEFWQETAVEWAVKNTAYRDDETLPPATPAFDWECEYCPYRKRCGQTNDSVSDTQPCGLLPLTTYPRQQLEQYFEAYPDAKLTPSTAGDYPELVSTHGVYDWQCEACGETYEYESIDRNGMNDSTPLCPQCRRMDVPAQLVGPSPAEQVQAMDAERQVQ